MFTNVLLLGSHSIYYGFQLGFNIEWLQQMIEIEVEPRAQQTEACSTQSHQTELIVNY